MTKTLLTIGISDCAVSKDERVVLATHALGSCIAVVIHDPAAQVGGMLHYMLPESAMGAGKGHERPFMYADTGIPLLFRSAYELGAVKSRLIVTAVGGAQIIQASESLEIGKRNYLAMRKILWKAGVMIHREEIGGNAPRTVHFEVGSGQVLVFCGREIAKANSGQTAGRGVRLGP